MLKKFKSALLVLTIVFLPLLSAGTGVGTGSIPVSAGDGCNNNYPCIVVTLAGQNIPSTPSISATRNLAGDCEGLQATYTNFKSIGNNSYVLSGIRLCNAQPGAGYCSSQCDTAEGSFQIQVYNGGGGPLIGSGSANLHLENTEWQIQATKVTINVSGVATPTGGCTGSVQACTQEGSGIQTGCIKGVATYDGKVASPATNGGLNTPQPLTLTGPTSGNTQHVTFNKDGSYQQCNLVPGTYSLIGTVQDPTKSFPADQQVTANNFQVIGGQTIDPNLSGGDTPAASASSQPAAPTCLSTDGTGGGWIMCQIFNAMGKISDFLFANVVQPFLRTAPISTDPSDPTYQVWSSFRVYGDIFLIIGLLVIVFSEAIGGGLIDAYTARKALPRLLAAAILINLSIYIVAFLVDLTNIAGQGIGVLMTAPLKDNGAFHITLNGIAVGKIGGVSALVGISAIVLAMLKTKLIADAGAALLLFVIMPAVFGLIAAFITLVLRKGIILALVMVSPVAFALYCLPNTEKYFKKWWDALLKTLLVYPIVIVFFAVANILSVTISQANGSSSALGGVMSFLLQFLPLLFIPYAFRLAGGAIGQVHELLTNSHKRAQEGIKGNVNDPNSLRNKVRRRFGNDMTDARVKMQNVTKGRRFGMETLGRIAGGGAGMMERQAFNNEAAAKRIGSTLHFGQDDYVRALTIPLSALNNKSPDRYRQKNGVDGWLTADGTWVSGQTIREAHRYYSTQSDMAQAFSWMMEKAEGGSRRDHRRIAEDYAAVASEMGMDKDSANGIWNGLGIAHKNIDPSWRRMKLSGESGNLRFDDSKFDHAGHVREVAAMNPSAMASWSENAYEPLERSIVRGLGDADPDVQRDAVNAANNLQRFVMGAHAPGAGLTSAQLAQIEATGGNAEDYGFSSADYANARAAREARKTYDSLKASHGDIFEELPGARPSGSGLITPGDPRFRGPGTGRS